MSCRTSFILLLAALLMGSVGLQGEDRKVTSTPALMKQKLSHASELLAGLASEDCGQIAKHAQALDDLTQHRWRTDEPNEYRANLKVFRFATSEMKRLADDKNLDGAALAYVQLTLSCVNCHRQLRQKAM